MTNRQARKLAREIVDDLLTTSGGIKAERLVLGIHSEMTLGAWGEAALFARILGHLSRYVDKPTRGQARDKR